MGRLFGGVALVTLLTVCGCGDGVGVVPAKGTLTWEDGKPIAGASLRLVPKVEGRPEPVAMTQKDGSFSLSTGGKDGAPRGDYAVVVTKMSSGDAGDIPQGQMTPEQMIKAMQAFKDKAKKTPTVSEVPGAYASPTTSPLTLTISGSNTAIQLKVKK